jgi:ATP-dependent helicase/nuclease subunit B
MSSATLSDLLDALERGELLLVPNARAARELRSGFDARQRSRGRAAWESPRVLSWSQWTSSQWSELVVAGAESRLLLNAAQEHTLWREIIAEDATNGAYGAADSLAELAGSAWALAAGYNATQRLREFAQTHDSRVFAEWAESFSKRCAARGYLSVALLDAALQQHVQAGAVVDLESLALVGFGQLTPSQEALLAGLRARGTEVTELRLECSAKGERSHGSAVAANEREELVLAMQWIRGYLEAPEARERGARVAVLLPDLPKERSGLEEVMREILAPELQSIDADLSSTPWEFSGGVALSSLTIICDALTLARWANGSVPLARVSSLLLSPYVGENGAANRSRDSIARFDVSKLRRTLLLRSELEIAEVLEQADRHAASEEQAPLAWLRSMQKYLQRVGDKTRLRSFAEWMEFIRGLTHAANWPGDRALTASEFEATRAWESTLDLVSTLDFSGRRIGFASALEALESQAQKTTFAQPSTNAAVQVMSVTESVGSVFDATVFLRATDANWPASERVNPLLPWALQRSLSMPGSDPALAAARCRAFTEDLLRRSGSVLFMHALEDDSGTLRPSPLLSEMEIKPVDVASLLHLSSDVETVVIESVMDDDEVPTLPSNEVAGGATVLKLQAACGFLAFAQLRLRAREPESGDMGLDAGESGSLLHRTLQHFWGEVQSQDTLRAMSWVQRDEVLSRSIDQALDTKLQTRNEWDRAYVAVVKQRLRSILQKWLAEELRRGPFRVLAVERNEAVTVGPLTLNVRMDRIDQVGDGVLFVDYKTGFAAHPKQWIGDRPDEPQLPLYALLPEAGTLKGVAFAKVRTGRDMKWLGYQSEDGILPVSKANTRDMASLANEWREALTRLAEDFAAGRADVKPKSFEVNCARCAQRLLCRIDPTSLLTNSHEDAEDEIDG